MTAVTKAKKRPTIVMRQITQVLPADENDKVYDPANLEDPEFKKFVGNIKANGVKNPLHITRDVPAYIISGHRRRAAACAAGLTEVPCIVNDVSIYDDRDEFLRLLVMHNAQRDKTFAEQVREAVVTANTDEPYVQLLAERSRRPGKAGPMPGQMAASISNRRNNIGEVKRQMADAIIKVVVELVNYWPLSVRQIHYKLLNLRPFRNTDTESPYENDRVSYKDLCDLAARMRLTQEISWHAITDETRPFQPWDVHRSVRSFLDKQIAGFGKGYWRNLMQSQPTHIEIVGEKLTIAPIINPVAARYTIPTLIGRGYCSLEPRRALADRFRASGKDHLTLLMLSDFDPDGEIISQSFVGRLRKDFNIHNLTAIRVALTQEHVTKFKLPPLMEAKSSSVHHGKFVQDHGKFAYELEALEPATLQQLLTESIDRVIDPDMLNKEMAQEKEDAAKLAGIRQVMLKQMGELSV